MCSSLLWFDLISPLLSDETIVVSCRLEERLVKTLEKPKLKPYPDRQELDYRYVLHQYIFISFLLFTCFNHILMFAYSSNFFDYSLPPKSFGSEPIPKPSPTNLL